jgi:iron complex outermembrane receptor protein
MPARLGPHPDSYLLRSVHRSRLANCIRRVIDICVSRKLLFATVAMLGFVALSQGTLAQDQSASQSSGTQSTTSPNVTAQSPAIPRVTTTVTVHDEGKDDYLPGNVTAGTLDGAALRETPISAAVVTRDLLNDQAARTLSDVVKNDASVGEDYAPVGYYGDYEIRGFAIDLATGLQINGMTIAGEQDVPLENKERVEILKGIAGVESGVASAGGLINYVTKRPAFIQTLDVATDQRGSSFGGVDLGRLLGSEKQFGARVNLAGEKIQTYVKDANGWRAMGAGAVDWKLTSKAFLKTDFEYQHKVERSVSGYQLLGGTTVPRLDQVFPSTMLGEQSWSKPNTFDTYNTNARVDYDLPHGWKTFAAASYSHSLIDDNVVYAYGASYDDQGNVSCPGAPDAPYYFFCPDGTYGIYDYRNPGELRIDAQAEALVMGHIKAGSVSHEVAGGGQLFRCSVQQPGYYSTNSPSSPDGVVQDGAVYTYVGSENIYQPIGTVAIEMPHQAAGPRRLYENNHQGAGIVQDRMRLPGRIQLFAAARFDSLRDHNYSPYATDPQNSAPIFTDKTVVLPQYAVTFNPFKDLTLYGNYGVMLSLAQQAPFWTDNGSQFLSPFRTRQAEAGAKYAPGQKILLSMALFHMRAPFFYPRVVPGPDSFCPAANVGDLCFESQGHETHDGIEVNAEGKAADWLRLTASAAGIRAQSSDTGTPSFDNKQVINVPRLRTTLFADVALPHARGLHLMPGWSYSGRKQATRDDTVSVASYTLFNLGAKYTPGGEQGKVTLRLYTDNIANKRYWKDTGASFGDTFIHLGAPTTVRLSAHYTF